MKEAQDSLDFDGEDGLVQQMLQRTDQRAKTVMRGLKTELRREETATNVKCNPGNPVATAAFIANIAICNSSTYSRAWGLVPRS